MAVSTSKCSLGKGLVRDRRHLEQAQDWASFLYPLLYTGDKHWALGRAGLLKKDLKRLGPLVAKVEQMDISPWLDREHTLLGAVAHPQIARRIAPYVWAPEPVPVPSTLMNPLVPAH